jgi:hypothetical protein
LFTLMAPTRGPQYLCGKSYCVMAGLDPAIHPL